MLDTLVRDLRYAVRMLRRSPGFTATALVTLALVIGGNTAVGSLADAILLRPLPYPQPDRLATVVTNVRSPQGALDAGQPGWRELGDAARPGAHRAGRALGGRVRRRRQYGRQRLGGDGPSGAGERRLL